MAHEGPMDDILIWRTNRCLAGLLVAKWPKTAHKQVSAKERINWHMAEKPKSNCFQLWLALGAKPLLSGFSFSQSLGFALLWVDSFLGNVVPESSEPLSSQLQTNRKSHSYQTVLHKPETDFHWACGLTCLSLHQSLETGEKAQPQGKHLEPRLQGPDFTVTRGSRVPCWGQS